MPYRHLSLAALAAGLTLATGCAFAQPATSSLAIFGRINLSVERQEAAGDGRTVLVDNASLVGLRGSEDLGGGLRAGFVLEHGFNADTGAAAGPTFWAREATVSLGGAFGTLRLGNMPASEAYFATADAVSMHNHDAGSTADALYGFVAVGALQNAIAYTSPTIAGLRLDVQHGLKEDTKTDSPLSLALSFDRGALRLALGHEDYAGNTSTALRALVDIGDLTLGGYVERGGGDTEFTHVRLAARVVSGPGEFHANLGVRGDTNDVDGTAAHQLTLGYNHHLSRRSKVYAFVTRLDSEAGSGDLTAFIVGLRHDF